jgi:hypothetical protein
MIFNVALADLERRQVLQADVFRSISNSDLLFVSLLSYSAHQLWAISGGSFPERGFDESFFSLMS